VRKTDLRRSERDRWEMIGDRQTGDTSRDIQIGMLQRNGEIENGQYRKGRQTDRQKVDKQKHTFRDPIRQIDIQTDRQENLQTDRQPGMKAGKREVRKA
jgi:hypothetical protein